MCECVCNVEDERGILLWFSHKHAKIAYIGMSAKRVSSVTNINVLEFSSIEWLTCTRLVAHSNICNIHAFKKHCCIRIPSYISNVSNKCI